MPCFLVESYTPCVGDVKCSSCLERDTLLPFLVLPRVGQVCRESELGLGFPGTLLSAPCRVPEAPARSHSSLESAFLEDSAQCPLYLLIMPCRGAFAERALLPLSCASEGAVYCVLCPAVLCNGAGFPVVLVCLVCVRALVTLLFPVIRLLPEAGGPLLACFPTSPEDWGLLFFMHSPSVMTAFSCALRTTVALGFFPPTVVQVFPAPGCQERGPSPVPPSLWAAVI